MALKTSRPARLCVVVMVVVCVGGRTADSSESVRRSDDTSGWEVVVQGLSQKVEALEAKLQALESSQGQAVAFFVQFKEYHHTFASDNTVLKFDDVRTNVGNAYHSDTGRFVAPKAGVYAFYLNLLSDHDHSVWQNVCIMKNSAEVALTQLADSASLSVMLLLQPGDTVWVNKRDGPGTSIYGINHTTFSGMLVTATN